MDDSPTPQKRQKTSSVPRDQHMSPEYWIPRGITPITYEREYPPQDPNDLIYQSAYPEYEDYHQNSSNTSYEVSKNFSSNDHISYKQDASDSPSPSVDETYDFSDLITPTVASGITDGTNMQTSFPPPPSLVRATSHKEFPFEELHGKYTFLKYLGRGSYGEVIEAKCNRTGQRVAIKKVKDVFTNTVMARRLLRELRILRELRQCALVINVIDILHPSNLRDFDTLYIVFQYFDTDLHKLINSDQYLTAEQIQWMVWQLLVGLKYVHSCNIVHRDLKPANILVNLNCALVICDFGLSRGLSKPHQVSKPFEFSLNDDDIGSIPAKRAMTTHVVTRWYRAPEVLLQTEYSTPIDLWSIGCIFADLLGMQRENEENPKLRVPLFPGTKSAFSPDHEEKADNTASTDQLNVIFDVIGTPSADDVANLQSADLQSAVKKFKFKTPMNYHTKFAGASDAAIDLLSKLLRFDPSKRYTVDQALEHPFLKKTRNRNFEISGKDVLFEFEDREIDAAGLRSLIVEEIRWYNPEMKDASKMYA